MIVSFSTLAAIAMRSVFEFFPMRPQPPLLANDEPVLLLAASCETVDVQRVESSAVEPFTELDKLGELTDGWDGDDAARPNDAAIWSAKANLAKLIHHGLQPDDVDADVLGGVGVVFIGRTNPEHRGWLACMNSGNNKLVLTDGADMVRTIKLDSDPVWAEIVTFLG